MPLYLCEACGAYDNSGLTDFWVRQSMGLPALCSACSPGLRWHDRWAKASAVGMLIDAEGFLWHPQQLLGLQHTTIVGIVQKEGK